MCVKNTRCQSRCYRAPSGPSIHGRWQSQWLRHIIIQTSPSLKPKNMKMGSPLPGQKPQPPVQKQQPPVH